RAICTVYVCGCCRCCDDDASTLLGKTTTSATVIASKAAARAMRHGTGRPVIPATSSSAPAAAAVSQRDGAPTAARDRRRDVRKARTVGTECRVGSLTCRNPANLPRLLGPSCPVVRSRTASAIVRCEPEGGLPPELEAGAGVE